MKTRRIIALAAAVCAALISFEASAQNKGNQEDWKKRMVNEKIAFITTEIDLQPEEAQKFWPVYNQVSSKKDKAFGECGQAYGRLDRAIREGKPENEVAKLLDAYVKAQKECNKASEEAVAAYGKVLPASKVAKLIVAEERFRRNMFQRMHKGGPEGHGNQGGGQHNQHRPAGTRN